VGRKQKIILAFLGFTVATTFLFTTTDVWFNLSHRGQPSPAQLEKAFPGDSQRIFDNADQLTLFALDPSSNPGEDENYMKPSQGFFHGYRIVGKTMVRGRERARLLRTIYSGISDEAEAAACFSPGHGLRASRDGQNVDVVICFGCQQLLIYSPKGKGYATISRTPRAYFNSALTSSGVPLSSR